MTPQGRNIVAGLVLLILALPSGLCSGFFTLMGIGSLFERDALARSIAPFILVCAAVGWVFCVLMILLWRRLRRRVTETSQPEATP